MSVLTKNERDGLDEVFLSIHTSDNKYQKIKNLASFLLSSNSDISVQKLLNQAKYGLKETKLSQYLLKSSKKKKNLSK